MIKYTSLCRACSRLRPGGTCAAFPNGIPEGIIRFGADHTKRIPGDRGIQFNRKDGSEAKKAFADWKASHDT